MRLHYMGKYDLDPASLPHGEHMPGAVPFREAADAKQMAVIANLLAVGVLVLLAVPAFFRCREAFRGMDPAQAFDSYGGQFLLGCLLSLAILFPHELLHAACFREDVYLYTNWKQGMLFVVGPETMSKGRFVFMSLLPNLVFGLLPYCIGMADPTRLWLLSLGILAASMGAGDYYNVFNALTQMPKGARTYLYQFNSYWYLPQDVES